MNISNDNDALIAAAPDLLEAVAAFVQFLDEEAFGYNFPRQMELCVIAERLARAALAKARGHDD